MFDIQMSDSPVVLFHGEKIGLLGRRSDSGTAVLEFTGRGGHILRFLRHDENHALEIVDGVRGPLGELKTAFVRGTPAISGDFAIDDFTLGNDQVAEQLMFLAIRHDYTWRLGVRAACAIRDPNIVARLVISRRPEIPSVIRIACLPVAAQIPAIGGGVMRTLIEQAHSRHWPESSEDSRKNQPHWLAVRATTAAYLYARDNGIEVNDTDGLCVIRQEALVNAIVHAEHRPFVWLAQDIAPL